MIARTLPFAAALAATLAVPAATAQKANVAYYEDAPQPIGRITTDQIETLAQSDFTHIIFAFINLCTPDSASSSGFDCPGTDPVPVWNINAVYDDQGNPIPEVQTAMQTLTDAGKTLYMSIGAAVNAETWDYMAGASADERTAAAQALQKFMTDYHVTGVDFDYEAGSSDGFGALASALAGLSPVPPFSMAPYVTDPSATSSISTQWQYCQFLNAGVTPTLINRQYYSGGITSDVVAGVRGDLQPFNCSQAGGSSDQITISASQMSPGIGVPGVSTPNCSQASASPIWGSCAEIGANVVAAFPDIAGMSLWNIDGLGDTVQAYACEMSNALNGTKKACN